MIDIVTYWLVYGLTAFITFGMTFYWICKLVDMYVSSITSGDFDQVATKYLVYPVLSLLGSMAYCDKYGYSRDKSGCRDRKYRYLYQKSVVDDNITWNSIILFYTCLIGTFLGFILVMVSITSGRDLLVVFNAFVEKRVMGAADIIIIPLIFLLLHTALKNGYKKFKTLKTNIQKLSNKIEEIENENGK
ncbi:hypothetical protein [Vibrio phage RYC]|nr:hypothetical protein [Vibrio phage RYC]